MYQFNRDEYEKRMEWYRDARFGMFIHWGLYSIPARGEWIRSTEEMTIEEYQKYFEEFDAQGMGEDGKAGRHEIYGAHGQASRWLLPV
jgi:hypothetical protein